MDLDQALAWLEEFVLTQTGNHLSELQRTIVEQVWLGRTYGDIADRYGCTEGHAKDVGSDLWKQLSALLGDRVSKKNMRTTLLRHWQQAQPHQAKWSSQSVAADFVGRAEAIAHLHGLAQRGAKVIVIQGEGGIGKTILAQRYLQAQGFEIVLDWLMAKDVQNLISAEQVVEEWLKQDFQEDPGLTFGIALERLKRHLRRQRVGILIDNLEPALDSQGQWRAEQRNAVELLRILADPQVQGLTLMTSRDRLCEPSVTVNHYRLPGLSLTAWEQAFAQAQIPLQAETLKAMHHAYGGNAKAMHILAGGIQTEYGGDMDAYWTHSAQTLLAPTDLKNLIDEQLRRLQQIAPMAYRLFCRLGCYRYQDVPTIPLAGVLALLWDCPEPQRRLALMALQNRSLIEASQGTYSLHPVLREAAILHLQDPMETHRAAAQFWTDHVGAIHSTQDALQALEAHYHYRAIGDTSKAGRVILKSRLNQWQQYLPLGSTLYRMGLLQPLLATIPAIIEQLQGDYTLSELYNILGDAYWITGQVQDAIAAQQIALTLSGQALAMLPEGEEQEKSRYYYTMLGIDSQLSMGLYALDLWELEQATRWFQGVMTAAQGTTHHRWAEKAAVCLALTQSYLGQTELAQQQAHEIYQILCCDHPMENRGSAAYFLQLLGQTYVNLGDFAIAEVLFAKVLSFSTASHYTQVQAKTLTGLAMMQREQQHFEGAIATHQQAIALLEGIGARCDLAEAYYQFGLTYGAMNQNELGQDWFCKAIRLFAAMDAPLQVSKVQASYGERGIS